MIFIIDLALGRGQNDREHHFARARRVKNEKSAVGWTLRTQHAPQGPVRVTLTRCMWGKGLDGDNLQGSLKAPRDAVAEWLGRDDADNAIEWVYAQTPASRGKGFMTIEIQPISEGDAS